MASQKTMIQNNDAVRGAFAQLGDDALVMLAQSGDTEAEEELLCRYTNLVRSKAHHYFLIGGDREDIVQEGMIGLYKAIRDYQSERERSFRSFADLCVTRQMITAIKMATRKKHGPLNSYVSLDQPVYDEENERPLAEVLDLADHNNPEDMLISQEDYQTMSHQIARILSPFEKQVLDQSLKGHSYLETAQKLGRSTKSIDNALQRIKKKLEERLVISD